MSQNQGDNPSIQLIYLKSLRYVFESKLSDLNHNHYVQFFYFKYQLSIHQFSYLNLNQV